MTETDAVTLNDYLRVARRRKWVLIQAALLLPLAAVAFSLRVCVCARNAMVSIVCAAANCGSTSRSNIALWIFI